MIGAFQRKKEGGKEDRSIDITRLIVRGPSSTRTLVETEHRIRDEKNEDI